MNAITVWEKPNCVQCRIVKQTLDKEGAAYQTKDLTDPKHAAQLEHFKKQGLMQAPIVQTPTDTFSGNQPDRVKKAVEHDRAQSAPAVTGPDIAGPDIG